MKKINGIKKFYKEHEEQVNNTVVTVGCFIGGCIIADYIITKHNMKTLKRVANKTVEYGMDLCNKQREEVNGLIEQGLGDSEECVCKTLELLTYCGGLEMAKNVKKTIDKM